MNRPEIYRESVDTLYSAYFNDTLKHSDCSACAVGNLLAKPARKLGIPNIAWGAKFMTSRTIDTGKIKQLIAREGQIIVKRTTFLTQRECMDVADLHSVAAERYYHNCNKLLAAAPYSIEELARIEYAFETAPGFKAPKDSFDKDYMLDEEWMFNGLVAVLEVLKDIHQVEDDSTEVERFKIHHQKKLSYAD